MENKDKERWVAGIFYYNPSNPKLFVKKRSGLGYTINHGNIISWFIILGVVTGLLLYKFL